MDEEKVKQPLDPTTSTIHPLLRESPSQNGKVGRLADNAVDETLNGGGSGIGSKVNKGPPKWRSQRFILGYFLFAGMMNMFFQRVNFSVAIVCMVNQTAISSNSPTNSVFASLDNATSSPGHWLTVSSRANSSDAGRKSSAGFLYNASALSSEANGSRLSTTQVYTMGKQSPESQSVERCSADLLSKDNQEDGPFTWTKQEQGLLLGAIYWTYTACVVPANHLLRNVRRKKIVVVSMGTMTAASMLLHVAALWSLWAVFVLKLVQGACTAVAMIAMYGMWMVWGPPHEMGKLLGFNLSGQMFSNIAVFPISALLCKYGFLGGWPSVFYVFGIISAVWLALFYVFVAETPAESRFITEEEKAYIVSSRDSTSSKSQVKVPWIAILTSRVMYALCCAQLSFAWNYFTFLATLPQYMKEVLKFDIESNGLYSMLPYLVMFMTTYASGNLTDCAIRRSWVRVVWARRISILASNLVPAVCLVALSFLDCTQSGLAIGLLVVSVGFAGFGLSAFQLVPYDVAPRFAPPMMTISTTLATLTGLVTPYVVASIAKDQTREQWQIVFFLTSGILILGALGFCLLTSGEIQSWAKVNTDGAPECGQNLDIDYVVEGGASEKDLLKQEGIAKDVGKSQSLIEDSETAEEV